MGLVFCVGRAPHLHCSIQTTPYCCKQIAEIGKYSMAILGWQHLVDATDWTASVYAQLAQAAILKGAHPHLPVFVYAGFGWGFGMNAAVQPLMAQPEGYQDWFLQSTDGPEYTRTNCNQMHSNNPHCVGWFWKFSNASARTYFVEKLVRPLATSPMIDGVFFDAFNYGYEIPQVRPFGRSVVNVPNCTHAGGAGCEALLSGTLDVARRTTELLNANGKVPIFANPAAFFEGIVGAGDFYLDERRLLSSLEGLAWMTYCESARAEQVTKPESGTTNVSALRNMLEEGRRGVAAGVHAYYQRNGTQLEDPLPHVAAFMLVREEHWYYFGSTGWLDSDWAWTALYDLRCGRPAAPALALGDSQLAYTRRYEKCSVTLDCTHARKGLAAVQHCFASIEGPGSIAMPSIETL
eukprot:6187362-Pleurochrysis_carterae.AAC.2